MKHSTLRKMVLTALFATLGYVLSTFVYFPQMAPFQHFVNVLAAVFVGPWYGLLAALLTGLMRMALNGSTLLAVIGAIFGAFLFGLLYRYIKHFWAAVVGEVIGTGIISALVAYPFMIWIYGLDLTSPFYYIPFFIPSSMMGAALALGVLMALKKAKVLDKLLGQIQGA